MKVATRARGSAPLPPPRSSEPQRLGLCRGRYPVLVPLWGDDGGVVLLIEGQMIDTLAAPSDVAPNPRVVLQRHALFDPDAELPGELVGALGQRCRRREGRCDLTVGVLDARGHDSPEELEDVLLVDRLVVRPALALDDLDDSVALGQQVPAQVL